MAAIGRELSCLKCLNFEASLYPSSSRMVMYEIGVDIRLASSTEHRKEIHIAPSRYTSSKAITDCKYTTCKAIFHQGITEKCSATLLSKNHSINFLNRSNKFFLYLRNERERTAVAEAQRQQNQSGNRSRAATEAERQQKHSGSEWCASANEVK